MTDTINVKPSFIINKFADRCLHLSQFIFHFLIHILVVKFQISNPEFSFVMCMKNNELDREFDKLVKGRMKKLNRINLKEELDFRENVSMMHNQDRDGDEVFRE